jgi:hypothetical protein
MFVLAETSRLDTGYLSSLIRGGTNLLRQVLVFLISLAVVWFIWNIIQYTISDDEDKKGKAKEQMIWGIVGIAVMVSVWGLVSILQGVFGLDNGANANNVGGNIDNMIPSIR